MDVAKQIAVISLRVVRRGIENHSLEINDPRKLDRDRMLIDLTTLVHRHRMKIRGIVHVGAHLGEEAADYAKNGVSTVYWIEGNEDIAANLAQAVGRFGHTVITAVVGWRDGDELVFHIANNGQSSSVLDLETHKTEHPEVVYIDQRIVTTRSLDSLDREYGFPGCNFMNLDIQGAELMALEGGSNLLKQIDWIYSEVNSKELYADCAKIWDIDDYLTAQGFVRLDTILTPHGWGDALYVRKSLL